jgi:hypothetical protein
LPSPNNCLPVYGQDHELLYYAPIPVAERLLANGRCIAVGTTHRIRALVAVTGQIEWLRLNRPALGQRYSHNRETNDNPRGVWTFRRLSGTAALAHG